MKTGVLLLLVSFNLMANERYKLLMQSCEGDKFLSKVPAGFHSVLEFHNDSRATLTNNTTKLGTQILVISDYIIKPGANNTFDFYTDPGSLVCKVTSGQRTFPCSETVSQKLKQVDLKNVVINKMGKTMTMQFTHRNCKQGKQVYEKIK